MQAPAQAQVAFLPVQLTPQAPQLLTLERAVSQPSLLMPLQFS